PEDEILDHHVGTIIEAINKTKPKMEAQLEEYNQTNLLDDLELPLARILCEMEETGIYTVATVLQEMEKEIKAKLDVLIN
ncbi:hypothetical protein, partial [Staphylococcus epidermidis]|uniref:hypothetical protein n=1 Tax=Staphylococcus epidermidis TaxID=1282 RepID=UPI0030BAF110